MTHGLRSLAPVESPDEWLWLLTADTAPEPHALERLLAAVEVAPSVSIAGPKLVDPDERGDAALLRREHLAASARPCGSSTASSTRRSTTPTATCSA